jgi:hypothetical protein
MDKFEHLAKVARMFLNEYIVPEDDGGTRLALLAKDLEAALEKVGY